MMGGWRSLAARDEATRPTRGKRVYDARTRRCLWIRKVTFQAGSASGLKLTILEKLFLKTKPYPVGLIVGLIFGKIRRNSHSMMEVERGGWRGAYQEVNSSRFGDQVLKPFTDPS